jgi:hypothetical protein
MHASKLLVGALATTTKFQQTFIMSPKDITCLQGATKRLISELLYLKKLYNFVS